MTQGDTYGKKWSEEEVEIKVEVGIKSKMQLHRAFLKRKLDEYETLKIEIEELKREVGPDKSLSD